VTTLPIRTYGDPVLNQVTTDVENIDGKIAALAQTMIETMNEAPGVGLAANQVGVQKRLFVYDKGEGPFVVVNPRILETDGEWTFEEGCLSVPGLSWEITRANAVHLVSISTATRSTFRPTSTRVGSFNTRWITSTACCSLNA